MDEKTQQFLETRKPTDILNGLLTLANAHLPAGIGLPTIGDFTTIAIGSIPKDSEYRRFIDRSAQLVTDYGQNPKKLIAEYAEDRRLSPAEAKSKAEEEVAYAKQDIATGKAAMTRADLVYIEFLGAPHAAKEIANYIKGKAGPDSVIDAGFFAYGVPRKRGQQHFPESVIITQTAFDKVMKPLIDSQDIAPASISKGVEVDDTTPSDGKATLAHGAALGSARARVERQ
ncbi:MAG: hypothetical protein V4735_09195 [Pseudomonadota bacterium]